jgi:EAL domain-containing protein (putative c-di-GMP-specific phosphodiesterase class I)
VISLAHTLHLDVIGEGVETASQAQTLKTLGCDYGQGFLFGKPVSAKDASDVARLAAQLREQCVA